jgi:predicted small secreted protein
MIKKLLIAPGVLALVLLTGCNTDRTAANRDVDRAGETAAYNWERERDEYRQTARARYDQLDRQINEMEADMKRGGARVNAETREAYNDLRRQRDELGRQIDRMGDATESTWNDFKRGVDSAMNDLERGYNNLLERMRTDSR